MNHDGKRRLALFLLVFLVGTCPLFQKVAFSGDQRTVGVIKSNGGASAGYVLFSPLDGGGTYLIDSLGRVVNRWPTTGQSFSSYLVDDGDLYFISKLEDGSLFNAGGRCGQIQRFDWDGNLEWQFEYSSTLACHHHDIEVLPNGNVLLIAWELRAAAEAVALGRIPGTMMGQELWPEKIVEVHPSGPNTGEIVWEWRVWDHLIQDTSPSMPNYGEPAENPHRVDINYRLSNQSDWMHVNGIDYNAELQQILLSVHHFNEVWVIPHSSSTEEAAGPGGDLLYRWGNPLAYGRGTVADQELFTQHDAKWIPLGFPGAGNITIFNNNIPGERIGDFFSGYDELVPPLTREGTYALGAEEAFGPTEVSWRYAAGALDSFHSHFISGCHRLVSGNTMGCAGSWGEFREVDVTGQVLWRYISPVTSSGILAQGESPSPLGTGGTNNRVFRAEKYHPDDLVFAGRDLAPGDYIEEYPECLGDLINDRLIDGQDLTILLGLWGNDGGIADIDENGLVDGGDLAILLGNWGECPDV